MIPYYRQGAVKISPPPGSNGRAMERQRCRPPSTPLDGYADPIISSGTIKLCGADYGKKEKKIPVL